MRDNARVIVYFFEMALFLAMLIFTIMKGPEHPQICFWGFIIVFLVVIVNEITPKPKDFIILIVGIIVLSGIGTIADKIVKLDNLIGFIIECIIIAPFFRPVWNHFIKMCMKANNRQ